MNGRKFFCGTLCALVVVAARAGAQQAAIPFPQPLDPGRNVRPLVHQPLPEEYIWTDGDVTATRPDRSKFPWHDPMSRTARHVFRAHFRVGPVPQHATLYIAGPRAADVYLNGKRLASFNSDIDAPIGFRVFHVEAAQALRAGDNVLAIAAVRGRGVVNGDASLATQQLSYGEVLAVKLLPAKFGGDGPPLVISDKRWLSTMPSAADAAGVENGESVPAWAAAAFDDKGWKPVMSLGPIESNRDFMQWSADAGMYGWPGYEGVSAPLGTFALTAAAVTHVFAGSARMEHVESLTSAAGALPFTVVTPPQGEPRSDLEAPAILLDFGREIAGRVLVQSTSDSDALLSVAYGESELEAMATGLTPEQRGGNYLGTNLLEVPAHGRARGPKSAFRYVRIRFLRGAPSTAFASIGAEAIAYPVQYAGSFESSDAVLNRIWETAAYTAHLCMQDDLWDAPKRDRGRWAGDIDVEGRVISDVFGDTGELERTLAALGAPGGRATTGIPGYAALWATSLGSLYAHSGDLEYLRTQKDALTRVVAFMDESLEPSGMFANRKHRWMFIDWVPGMYAYSDAALLGTNLQFLRGYRAAATMFDALGDHDAAAKARASEAKLDAAVRAAWVAAPEATKRTWQINALVVETGIADTAQTRQAVWRDVLSKVKQDAPEDQSITPYFNMTVLDGMAALGHRREALDWMRTYWGGMLAEGATSFWEAYDLRWPKDNPHLSLQADGVSGYFVSLAHGWSSGPAAWLDENVLGVRDVADGFRTVMIAPRLLGLKWAHGSVAAPGGQVSVSVGINAEGERIEFSLPRGVEHATISIEPPKAGTPIFLDGHPTSAGVAGADGVSFPAPGLGHHVVTFQPAAK